MRFVLDSPQLPPHDVSVDSTSSFSCKEGGKKGTKTDIYLAFVIACQDLLFTQCLYCELALSHLCFAMGPCRTIRVTTPISNLWVLVCLSCTSFICACLALPMRWKLRDCSVKSKHILSSYSLLASEAKILCPSSFVCMTVLLKGLPSYYLLSLFMAIQMFCGTKQKSKFRWVYARWDAFLMFLSPLAPQRWADCTRK